MPEYAQDGIRFEYPDDWELDLGESQDPRTVTVSSPETSFWCLSLFPDRPSVDDVLLAAVSAFQDEYENVDVYATDEHSDSSVICGYPAAGRDVEFVYLEMVNTVRIRVIMTDENTVLVLCQGADQELPITGGIMDEITQSLTLE